MEGLPSKPTILIVDDVPANVQVLSRILYQQGHNIVLAQSGQEALDSVSRRLPDLILLDIVMPGMDGFAVCRYLQEHPETRKIPIIFLTAKAESEDIVQGLEIGAVDYIVKPFRSQELLARVSTHLELKHSRDLIAAQNALLSEQNQRLERQNIEVQGLYALKEQYLSNALKERVKELNCLYQIAHLADQPALSLPGILQGTVDLIPPAWQYPDITCGRIVFQQQEYVTSNFRTSPWKQTSPIVWREQHLGIVEVYYLEERREMDEGPFLQEERRLIDAIAERVVRIVERMEAERALRTREQQYRMLAENVADGIGIVQNGRLIFVNDVLCDMLKYPKKQLLQMRLITLFAEQEHARMEQMLTQLGQEGFQRDLQAVCRTGAGREMWIEMRHSVIDWQGKPAIILTMHDITERKSHELAVEEEKDRLHNVNIALQATMKERYRLGDIIGKSLAMQTVYEQILSAAASDANVVICGESGTGKELVAWTIHRFSKQGKHAFVPVNCGAIPESLFESEFFGHRKGSFTGAYQDKHGVLEHARGGTLFLDEVGELAPAMQVKLLRALAGGGYSALGDHTVKTTDIRLITATHQNLADMVKQEQMREDFYYRIAVVPITLPPLRERKEDILLLVDHFLERFSEEDKSMSLPGAVLQQFYDYDWPGNVRELQNALQRYLTTQSIDLIAPRTIPADTIGNDLTPPDMSEHLTLPQAVASFERQYLLQVLEHYHWHRGKTAAFLGIDPKTLYRKLKQYQAV